MRLCKPGDPADWVGMLSSISLCEAHVYGPMTDLFSSKGLLEETRGIYRTTVGDGWVEGKVFPSPRPSHTEKKRTRKEN